jgi:hypothetical protein
MNYRARSTSWHRHPECSVNFRARSASWLDALRKLLLAHPEVSPAEFKAAVREQWAILVVDERAAIEALPQLLPTATERHVFSDLVEATVASTGKLNADGQRRLREVTDLLATGTNRRSATRGKLGARP